MTSLPAALSLLEAEGLLRPAPTTESEYLFRHALLREAAYASLLKNDRRNVHRVVGETLTQLYGDVTPEVVPVLARHFAEAGRAEQALRYFLCAAEQAAHRYANAEALSHYTEAHALATRLIEQGPVPLETWQTIYLGRGRVLELHSRQADALADYEHLLTLAQARADMAGELAALVAIAILRITPTPLHNLAIGEPLAHRALALAEQLANQHARARVHWLMLLLHHYRNDYATAVTYGEQAVQLARALGWEELLAYALNDLHAPYEYLRRYPDARAVLDEAAGLWRRLGNWPMLADTLGNLAGDIFQSYAWAEGFACTAEIRRISAPINNLWGLTYADWIEGYAYLSRGEWAAGLSAIERAFTLGQQGGLLDAQVFLLKTRASTLIALGDTETAWATLRQAYALVEAHIPAYRRSLIITEIWMHIVTGDYAQAQQLLAKHFPSRAAEMGELDPRAQWPLLNIEIHLAIGQPEPARALAERILNVLPASKPSLCKPYLLLLSRAHYALGAADVARANLLDIMRFADAYSLRPLAASACAALAQAEAAEAAHWQAELEARLRALAADLPPAYRASFFAQPDRHFLLLYAM